MNCHICGNELEPKLDLGRLPLANAFVFDTSQKEVLYSGVWSWCPECQLLQLAEPPKSDEMFTGDYPYKTSTSQTMLKHFEETAEALWSRYDPATVAEIGCSDGGMIQFLESCATVGFEPSKACWGALGEKRITYYNSFSKPNVDDAIDLLDSKFDLIYSANTLRSIPELGSLIGLAASALHPVWGCLVIEEPYLLPIIENNEFDQFYDENVFCFTATSMMRIAHRYGLRLYDVDTLTTHGGSVRYHLCQAGNEDHVPETEHLRDMLAGEAGLYDRLDDFNEIADRIGSKFQDVLTDLKVLGKRVVGYGATAKSSTVLCGNGIDRRLIQCIYDNSTMKIGKLTPVSRIPILDASKFKDEPEDTICVLFAWNHEQEVVSRENAIKPRTWLVYIPELRYL